MNNINISGYFHTNEIVSITNKTIKFKNVLPFNILNRSMYFINDKFNVSLSITDKFITMKYDMNYIPGIGDTVYFSFILSDFYTEYKNSIIPTSTSDGSNPLITINEDLIISGYLYVSNCRLIFDNSRFYIVNNGLFQCGDIILDNFDNPLISENVSIEFLGAGSLYGRDNYKQALDISPVNGTGKLVLCNTNVSFGYYGRSDFDFRNDTEIIVYNSTFRGQNTSYHHMVSDKMTFNNCCFYDVFSVELLKNPVKMLEFSSVNCNNGLSFYPTNASLDNPVSIYDLDIISPIQYGIKRNNKAGLILVDPKFDINSINFTGSAPIKVSYSTIDTITDDKNVILPFKEVFYYTSGSSIDILNGTDIKYNNTFLFHYGYTNSIIYITDSDKGFTNGEEFTISSISSKTLTLSNTILNTYIDPTAYIVIKKTSDEFGNVSVNIPFLLLPYIKNDTIYYNLPYRHVSHLGIDNILQFTPSYKKLNTVVISTGSSADVIDPIMILSSEINYLRASILTMNTNAKLDTVLSAITDVKSKVDGVETKIGGVESKIDGVETKIDGVESKVDGVETKVYTVETKIDGVDTKVDRVDTKIDTIETKVDTVETKVDGIETKVDGIETKVDAVEIKIDGVESKVDGVESKVDGVESKVDGVESKVDGVESKVDGVETKVDGVETKVDGVETKVDGVETKVDGVETKVDGVENSLISNLVDITTSSILNLNTQYAELKSVVNGIDNSSVTHGLTSNGEFTLNNKWRVVLSNNFIRFERKTNNKWMRAWPQIEV
jgi:peptidoglycan hydrolase CwlO-like protein